MPGRIIKITAGNVSALADIGDTDTAAMIWNALPISAEASTWGDEIYFKIPVKCRPEKEAKEVVQPGDIAYWPPGSAFCIFFGPTPASEGDEIRPASAVNVFGRVQGDPKIFRAVSAGEKVTLEKS